MITIDELKAKLGGMKTAVDDLRDALSIEASEKRLAELEHQMTMPGFYDDQDRSQKIISEMGEVKNKLERFGKLSTQYEEAETLLEMIEEENDPALAAEGEEAVNGVEKASHKGGYSLFRANVTDALHDGENLLAIWVDNTQRDDVYPQTADFTFYGGLYRGVNLITVEDSRFDLDYCGGKGFDVSAAVEDGAAVVSLDAFITNPVEGQSVEFIVRDAAGVIVAGAVRPAAERVHAEVRIENAHLWQGVKDPYLYAVEALLTVHNETIDNVSANLGVRTYTVDPQKGFFLNGVLTPLRGVSRHQDRLGQGNALTKEQHEEDVAFIREVGANTVRLAHYQHSPYFYDACDRAGLVVFHTTGRKDALDSGMRYRKQTVAMGLPSLSEYEIWQTDEEEFRACAEIVHSFAGAGA